MKKILNLYGTKDVFCLLCYKDKKRRARVEGDIKSLQVILNKLVSTVLHVGRNSYFHSDADLHRYLFYRIFFSARQLGSLPYFPPQKTHFSLLSWKFIGQPK